MREGERKGLGEDYAFARTKAGNVRIGVRMQLKTATLVAYGVMEIETQKNYIYIEGS